jgi:transmembrane Fragile-X-F protein
VSENSSSTSGGIGFLGLLTILFIGLKLTGYVGWSWWWVLAPIWIPSVVGVALLAFVGVGYIIKDRSERRVK